LPISTLRSRKGSNVFEQWEHLVHLTCNVYINIGQYL
jgi:hypothetical protein